MQKELRATADELKERMIDADPSNWRPAAGPKKVPSEEEVIEAELETEEAAANGGGRPGVEPEATVDKEQVVQAPRSDLPETAGGVEPAQAKDETTTP